MRYSANLAKERDRWGEAMREHEAILDALRRRAGSELSDILFIHLRNKRKAAQRRGLTPAVIASAAKRSQERPRCTPSWIASLRSQ